MPQGDFTAYLGYSMVEIRCFSCSNFDVSSIKNKVISNSKLVCKDA